MTDEPTPLGRVDFHAIADDPEFANVERVMAAVLRARSLRAPSAKRFHHDVFSALGRRARPLAAAAAVLLAASLATLALIPRTPASAPQHTLATWVQSNHVPTNGELLSTFQGYGR
jgi:hypothetical protein